MFLWISDPVSDILFSQNGNCKELECGHYTGCDGVKCDTLKKCECYQKCTIRLHKKKKKRRKKK